MSQHDGIIADSNGLAFLADLNEFTAATLTNNSGPTEPTTTYAFMWWVDTSTGLLKRRNATDSDWISLMSVELAISTYAESLLGAANSTAARNTLGLGSVDDTADADKPVSEPQQAVFDIKANRTEINTIGAFTKANSQAVLFTKTGANTASIKAGTYVDVAGSVKAFTSAAAITMPSLVGGVDYAIYVCADGTVRADASFSAPTGYTTATSRLIGGFHYGLVASGTTVASGSFNSSGSPSTGGMVWTQGDVDKIAGINQYSFWDLKWRSDSSDLRAQKGFVLTDSGVWVAAYIASTDADTNGLSRYNTNVASGTVLPKISTVFGGNGTLTYPNLTWWVANEMVSVYGARLMRDAEASIAFFGVTENQSLGGASSTIPATLRQPGYTSKYGIEQATGHHWIWGDDSGGAGTAYVANGGRGQSYASGVVKVILGGVRDNGANSGSRTSIWYYGPTDSYWNIGVRAACDHLILA